MKKVISVFIAAITILANVALPSAIAETGSTLPAAAQACVAAAIGQDRLNAILAHTSAPTPTEMEAITKCTASNPPTTPPAGGMPQLDSNIEDCIKTAIGADAFAIISNGTVPPTAEQQALMKACFSDVPKPGGADNHPAMSPDLVACLQAAVGADRFAAIRSGQSKPTDAEEVAGKACFAKFGEKPPTIEATRKISASVEQCLKLALGEQRYADIKAGKSLPNLTDRDAGQKCFGAPSGPMSPDVGLKMGTKLQACLKEAIGLTRFTAISTGAAVPTATDRAKGATCLKHNQDANSAETILPPAPQEVPFLPINEGAVDITKESVVKKDGKPILTLQGKGKPGTVVDLHLFSKPTTTSVQVDKKGNWKYTFNRLLSIGQHHAYATTRKGKQTVRSTASTITLKK